MTNPRTLRPGRKKFQPSAIQGLALWLDSSDPAGLYTTANGPVAYSSDLAAILLPYALESQVVGWWSADAPARYADEPDDGQFIILDANGRVQSWVPNTEDGTVAGQADSSARPSLVLNAYNGKPCVRFNGTSGLFGNFVSPLTSSTRQYFVVCKISGAGGGLGRVFSVASSSTSDFAANQVIPCLQNGQSLSELGSYSGVNGILSRVGGFGSLGVFTSTATGATTYVACRTNGSSGNPSPGPTSLSGQRFGIGFAAHDQSAHFVGDICEIIALSVALPASTTAEIERALAVKWGIAGVHSAASYSGAPVGYVRDRSGNNRHATQALNTSRPSVAATTQNGRRQMTFDGTDDILSLGNLSAAFPTAAELFVVLNNMSDTAYEIYATRQNNSNSGSTGLGRPGAFRYTSVWVANNYLTYANKPLLWNVRSTASSYVIAVDGVQKVSLSNSNYAGGDSHQLGGSFVGAGAGGSLAGRVMEVVAYNKVLSSAERTKVEQYLAQKWGVVLNPLILVSAQAPDAPTGLQAVARDTQAALVWTAPNNNGGDISAYEVQYSSDSGSTWTTFAGGADSDPYYQNVALLLHLNNSLTDSSLNGLSVTPAGNAQISGVQSRFGDGSLLLDGNGDYLEVADNGLFDLGASDFTLEAWVRFSSISTTQAIVTKDVSSPRGWQWRLTSITNNIALQFWGFQANGTFGIASAAWTPELNTWYHIAISRTGTTYRQFVNGVLFSTDTLANAANIQDTDAPLQIGSCAHAQQLNPFNGNIDEVRITTGVCRYVANFAPPIAPFTDGSVASSAIVTGLTNGTSYVFRVAATNFVGTGQYSSPSNAVSPAPPPNAPTELTAIAGDGQASLSWSAPSNNGAIVTDYLIQYSTNAGASWFSITDGASSATSYVATGLTNQTTYTFRVAAVSSSGAGAYSASSQPVTPAMRPSIPTGLTATGGDSQVALAWTAPASDGGAAITDYIVQYSTNAGSTWTTFADGTSTSTSATVTGLTNGTAYVFRVAAVNAIGTGTYTGQTDSVTPNIVANPPGSPTAVVGTPDDQSVWLSWTPPAVDGGAVVTDYAVQYSANSGSTWTTFSDGTSALPSAKVTGLTNGTSYVFRVAAVNIAGAGSYSTNSAAITPAVPTVISDDWLTSNVLHLHCNGTNGSTSIIDSGPLSLPVAANGNAQISTAQGRFGGASVFLDGTGDFLSLPSLEVFQFQNIAFTLEAYVFSQVSTGVGGLFSFRNSSSFVPFVVSVNPNGTFRVLIQNSTGGSWIASVSATASGITPGAWQHVAITGSGSTVRLFANGVLVGSWSQTNWGSASYPLYIGSDFEGSFTGYIDEVRVTRGVARYTASFTPPVAPFQDAGSTDQFRENTALLLSMDGSANSTSFPDSSRHSRTVTASGTARVNASVGKYGQSLETPSASDYVAVDGQSLGLRTGDFTVEGWYMRSAGWSSGGSVSIWSGLTSVSGGNRLEFYVQDDDRLVAAVYGTELVASTSLTWNSNQWYHLAVTRSNGAIMRLFRDGVQVAINTNRTNNFNSDTSFVVGQGQPNHFVDDVRVTRGVARYVAAFTPPTSAHATTGLAPQNADAASWMDRVYEAGGNVSPRTATAVNRLCNAIDAAGLRDRFYRLNLFCGTGLTACLVPLYRGPSFAGTQYGNTTDTSLGPFVTGDYTEVGSGGGLKGNGTSKYLNTGLLDSSLPGLQNRHLAVYSAQYLGYFGNYLGVAKSDDATYSNHFQLWRAYGDASFNCDNAWDAANGWIQFDTRATFTSALTGGFLMGSRLAGTSRIYENGILRNTSAANSAITANTGQAFFVFTCNHHYGPGSLTNEILRGYSIGLDMTDAQAAAYNTIMQNFQQALGRAV